MKLLRVISLVALLGGGCTGSVMDMAGTGDRAGAGPGSGAPGAAACGATTPARLWKLTPEQYTHTAQALLGTKRQPGLDLDQGLSREAGAAIISAPHAAALYTVASRLADEAAATPKDLHPCLADKLSDPSCVRQFISDFGSRAFRRDLADTEVASYTDFFQRQAAARDLATALRLVVRAMLLSPSFLFRFEIGPDGAAPGLQARLTPFERASAIAYFLTDGPPDGELMSAARTGGLETRAQIAAQARRLLQSPDTGTGVMAFLTERLRLDDVREVEKDFKKFPQWTPDLPAAMAEEARLYLRQVLWKDGARFDKLLTASYGFPTARLAALYGLPTGTVRAGAQAQLVELPANRAGLLTLGATMARLARPNDTAPSARGIFVRELLCQPPPPPPANVNAVPVAPDGQRTQRERLENHRKDPSCAGCHGLFDPLGLAFESYDAIARYRTSDLGVAIDTSGVLTGIEGGDRPFASALELAKLIPGTAEAQRCLVGGLQTYAQGLAEAAPGQECVVDRLQKQLAADGDLLSLAVAVVSDEAFFTRIIPAL